MLLFNDAAMQELGVRLNELIKCDSKNIYNVTNDSYIK